MARGSLLARAEVKQIPVSNARNQRYQLARASCSRAKKKKCSPAGPATWGRASCSRAKKKCVTVYRTTSSK
ncbi:hypothetical protein ACOSQ3_023491 [Xanthoceras sorbifolium]